MSTEQNDKNKDFSDVDPIVSETLDSALEQLHLDDLEEPTAPISSSRESTNHSAERGYTSFSGAPPSHMYPHPQMVGMGFIPYSQMMPVPPHSGYFPPPEFRESGMNMVNSPPNASGPIMFNNSNDTSVFAAPSAATFANVSLNGDRSAITPSDPLWHASDVTGQAVIDPVSSSAIEDSSFLEEVLPPKIPGGATITFRRQTFHALSPSDLINNTGNNQAIPHVSAVAANSAATRNMVQNERIESTVSGNGGGTRTQSISMEKTEGHPMFGSSDGIEKQEVSLKSSDEKQRSKDATNNTYAAAYPYGGPLLQPNPVLSGNHPPGSAPAYGIPSPFHGPYGFASPFQSFSPALGNPNSPIHGHSSMAIPHPPLQGAAGGDAAANNALTSDPNSRNQGRVGLPGEQTLSHLQQHQMSQHQQGGTPPPWMYGNSPYGMVPHPHAVPQGHPHGMHPNNNQQANSNVNHTNRRGQSHNSGNRGGRSGNYGSGKHKHNKNTSHQYYQNNGNYGDNASRQRKMEDVSRYSNASLDQFIGNIYSLCKDQHGCRFLQKQLEELGPEAADVIFGETKEHIVELMTDSFGNYLVQKLLERVTVQQRVTLAEIAAPHFVYVASNPHGTRALQKLVECVETDEEAKIVVDSSKPFIVELSKDLNGNHIVQKCLQKLEPKDVQYIFDAACEHCTDIATHRHGCCVLQRCLDHGTKEQRQALCTELLTHVDYLTLDPFGNYVVQYIITKESEKGTYDYTYKIVKLLKAKITELSLHKFGSNVIEKILRTPVVSEIMILELLNHGGESDIQALLNDGYGNYVLQTILDVSHENNELLYKRLLDIVRPLLIGPIRNTPHGRRIMGILQMD